MAKQIAKPVLPVYHITDPSAALVEALKEDSNHEVDWLHWASRVATREERLYCYERALYINPTGAEAQGGIAHLQRNAAQPAAQPAPARSKWAASS